MNHSAGTTPNTCGIDRRTFLLAAASTTLTACSAMDTQDHSASPREIIAWGAEGIRDGDFLRPRAIATRGDEVYVIDTTGRVQVFDDDGNFLRMWRTPDASNGTPTAIAFANDGRLLVPDTHYSRILEYSPDGELLNEWGEYGSGPDQFIYPTGIAQTADGMYVICEYGENAERVRIFDQDHAVVTEWGGHGPEPAHFNRAMAVELTTGSSILIADTTNHRIQRFDLHGALQQIIGEPGTGPGQLKFPFDIAAAPDDTFFAVEYGTHRVSRFTVNGEFISSVGTAGRDPGEFNAPRGVAVSESGRLYIADTDNHRIQRLTIEAASWS